MPKKRLMETVVITGSDPATFEENLKAWLAEQDEKQFVEGQFQVGPDGTLYERIYYTEG